MADKTVFYKDLKINASTISNLYTRLNALRSLGGKTALTVVNPVDDKIVPSIVSNLQTQVLNTKNALTFLSSVNISSFTPTTPTAGTKIVATQNIAKIEKEVGLLESACFTFNSGFRGTHHGSNFTSSADVVKTTHGTHHSSKNGTHHASHCSTVHSSKRGTRFAEKNVTFNSGNRSSGKDHHYWLFHSGNSFCSGGKQTNKGSHNTSHYVSFGKVTHHAPHNATNFGTRFATVGATNTTHHANKDTTVHASVNTTVHSSKNVNVFTTNFNHAVAFKANHGTFKVEGLDF